MKVFIAHGGLPPFLKEIEAFFDAIGIEAIVAEYSANNGAILLPKIVPLITESDFALVIWSQDGTDSKGNYLPSPSVDGEAGIIQQKFGNRVIYLREKGVQIPTIFTGLVYEEFTRDNLAPVFKRIIIELRKWGDITLGASNNQVRLLDENQIYDPRTIQSEESPKTMFVYVPVGFWAVGDNSDPKVVWTKAIQQRLLSKKPELQFIGIYGVPTHDKDAYERVTEVLTGFGGCRCIVRVFPAHDIRAYKSQTHTDAPGLGFLLAEYSNNRKSLLVACAQKPGSIRIDSAFVVTDLQVYDLFHTWFNLHVSKLGIELNLNSDKTIRRDLQMIWKRQHPPSKHRNSSRS
jgi:hypothetical protein